MAEQEMVIDLREVFGNECEMDYLATRRRRKSVCFEEEFDLDGWAQSPVYCTYSITPVCTDESIPSNTELEFERDDNVKIWQEISEKKASLPALAVPIEQTWFQFAAELAETVRSAINQAISNAKSIGMVIKENIFNRGVSREAPLKISSVNKMVESTANENSENDNRPRDILREDLQQFVSNMRNGLMRAAAGLLSPRLSTNEKTSISITTTNFSKVYQSSLSTKRSIHLARPKDKGLLSTFNRLHLTRQTSWKKSWLKITRNRKSPHLSVLPHSRKRSVTRKVQTQYHFRKTERMSKGDISKEE